MLKRLAIPIANGYADAMQSTSKSTFSKLTYLGLHPLHVLALVVLAYAFCALFDPFFFDYDLISLIVRQVHTTFLAFVILYLFTCIPYVGITAYFICLPFSAVCVYVYRTFKYSMGFDLVTAAFETNQEEASAFVNLHSILSVTGYISAGALIFILFRWLTRAHRKSLATIKPVFRIAFFSCLAVLWYAILQLPALAISLRPSLHFRLADNTLKEDTELFVTGHSNVLICHWIWTYDNFSTLYYSLKERYREVNFQDAAQYESHEQRQGADIIVLIIGESMRANHLPVNGYGRDTLPKLSRREDITFLNNMYSYGTSTYVSVEGIMAGLAQDGAVPPFTSFLSILRKHGYSNAWFSENTYDIIHSQRFRRLFGTALDTKKDFHAPIDNVSQEILNFISKSASKQCIIIENGTGHFPYKHDPAYSPFQPANIDWSDTQSRKQAGQATIINEYDNCIVCIDTFVNNIIEGLKDKNAVVLYCSDHGQKLGEQGKLMHGGSMNDPDLRQVASWVWLSDSYKANNRELADATPALSGKTLHQGQIYASILKLGGIESTLPLPVGNFWDDDITKHPNNLPSGAQEPKEKAGTSIPAEQESLEAAT